MKKGFSKLLLAIVMTLQLVPSSMTTIVANDNIAYADDFVQITTENKPIAVYETGSGDIPEGVSKLNVAVHVDGAEKTSGVLTFGSATNPEKTEITANANYAVEQVTVNGEAFDNSIVYNREVGESEKNLVINVYTKATATIHYQDLEGNRLAADDVKEGKLHELLTIDAKAINGYTALKENASVMVLENTSNEITLVYSKAELSAPVDISFDLAGGAYNNSEEPVIVHAERGNRISETAIPTPVLKDKNFKGWKLDQNQKIYSGKDISAMAIHSKMNFKAVYENKTYTKKAEFFVLLPSSELPKNLAGNYNPKNFVPSNSNPWYGPNWAGNDIMHNQGTGFSGFISDEAYQKAYVNKKPITNENGVDSNYIYVPEGHIPLKYTVRTGVDKGKEIELTNIVWYSIKRQDNQKPHVDGYIKAVEVEIGYFANIDGFDTSVIEHAVTGNEYEVKDYSSLEGFPQRKGYIFTGWNTKADGSGTRYAAHAKFTVKTSVALYAQWKKTDQKYTIQHFDEDSNKKIHDDEYKNAKFGDIIEGSSCQLPIENFTFTKANTLTVDTDNKKNIIKVYYSKDENKDQIPDKYQIKVMYKAVNGTIDAVHENEPGNKMFYVTLYKNGKYATVEDGGIGHLSDEQIATATAARGYDQNSLKWSPKTPTTKLDLNEDTSFIAEFTKGSYDYSIEYYYDGVKGKTDTKKAVFEEVITLNPDVSVTYGGSPYALDKVKNNPLTIDIEEANNIIRVYYAKDTNGNGKPDYKEETYNVNFVAGENGKLEGTTLYKDYLSGTAINSAEGYKEPKAVADEGYAFDKWVVKDVEHKAGIETAEPGTYKVTGNTVVYAEFAKDTNGNGKPDYKEETYNVNFVTEANGTLTGTTLYSGILANTRIGNIAGFAMPVPTANLNYAFDKWIVRDVNHPEGIEINDPSTYIIHSNTVFYASFEEDQHGSDSTDPEQPDNVPDKYQAEVSFAAVNGTVSFNKTYVTLYDKQGNYAEDGTGRLAQNQIATATANSGYHFVNWTPQTPKQGLEITSEGAAFTAHYAINTYTAVVRFLNEDTGEELAPAVTVNDIEHGTYLYGEAHRISIPGYVFTVADTKVVESEHVTVNVYYSADTKGGLPNPDTTPDGTPDKYQVRFAYVADTNGSVTGTTVEYVTRPGNNTTAAVRPQALVDAIANDGYSFMSWTANGNAYVNTDAMRNTYFTEDTVFTAGFAEVVAPILPTPVTPTPPAVTPQNPGTPIPAAPAAPQIPVNPIAPPIVVPVIPTPAPTPAPNPGPIVNEDDPDQPQGGESTEVQENPTPKGGGSQNEWALINLICAGGTVLLGLFLLLSKLKKEEEEEEEEDEKTSAMRNDEEQSNGYKRRKWLRVASTITAVVSGIAFFLTEDITLPMVLIDKWTLLMAAFLIVQVIFVLFGRKWKELDESENNAETAHS
ncbi:InlB B-repeat-containing protein [[Clostridium] innocuum]|nr:InlB B-repeat-containing protein [[Clostridium] innocuum]